MAWIKQKILPCRCVMLTSFSENIAVIIVLLYIKIVPLGQNYKSTVPGSDQDPAM